MAEDFDFIGFTFNGKHSYDDFGIYRTSNNDMYQLNVGLAPTDQTADHVGVNGLYFLGSTYKNQEFDIAFAFDKLTEEKLREMRQWFNIDQPKGLIFDEWPYKEYNVIISGVPTIKFVCFDQKTESGEIVRIYKGEGNVKFACHDVYARGVEGISESGNKQWQSGKAQYGDVPFDFEVQIKISQNSAPTFTEDITVQILNAEEQILKTISIKPKDIEKYLPLKTKDDEKEQIIWDSKIGLVYHIDLNKNKTIIPSSGNTFGKLEPGQYTVKTNYLYIIPTFKPTYRYI